MARLNFQILRDLSFNTITSISTIFLILIIFTHLPIFIDYMTNAGNSGNPVYAPLFYITLFFMAAAIGLFQFESGLLYLRTPLVIWTIGFMIVIALNIWRLHLLDLSIGDIELQVDAIERLSILPIVGFICLHSPRRIIDLLIPVSCILICGGIIIDFVQPNLLSPIGADIGSGRARGFYINANAGAEAVALALALSRSRVNRHLFMALYLLCGAAIILTFSRSGILIWLVVGMLSAFSGQVNRFILLVPFLVLLGLNIFTTQIQDYLESFPEYQYKTENMLSRLSFFSGSVGGAESEIAEDSRVGLLQEAVFESIKKPIFGHGYSYVDDVNSNRSHNMILELFHLYGIVGLVIWLSMLYILFDGSSQQPLVARLPPLLFLFFSFFSHNIFEYVFYFVFFSIAIYVDGTSTIKGKKFVNSRTEKSSSKLFKTSKSVRKTRRRRSSSRRHRV